MRTVFKSWALVICMVLQVICPGTTWSLRCTFLYVLRGFLVVQASLYLGISLLVPVAYCTLHLTLYYLQKNYACVA